MYRQLNMDGITKIQESISFIRENEPEEGYFVGYSGGKDSEVILELCKMAGVKYSPYYSATGIDPPEVVKHIKNHHPDVVFLRPKKSFYKMIVKKGFPTKFRRWCCDDLKKNPAKNIPLKYRIMGIRAEESSKRAKRGRVNRISKNRIIINPIFYWKEWEIWGFIDERNLPYCGLYDEGFGRIGCVVCPFLCSTRANGELNPRLVEHQRRWPGIYRAFERAMYELWEAKGHHYAKKNGFAQLFEEFLENWYRGIS